MKIIGLANRTDSILGVPYELVMVESAKDLSDNLKKTLTKKGIDYAKYNSYTESTFSDKDKSIQIPPQEIYEYQNFFVLENAKGDFILLDGFRRLLWYNAPATPILIKIYKEKNLTNQQVLTLLVNLNHFKFFSNQSYHERGFSLLLKTVFDVDITTFRRTFDAYLSSTNTKNSYSSSGQLSGQSKNEEIKNRIVGEHFVSDVKFLEKLNSTKYLCDQYMGALLFEHRTKTTEPFDVDKFIELADNHAVLQDLTVKYEKVGTDNSAKSQEIVNKIIEIYRNLFILMEGGEVTTSFAEKQKEAKDLVDKLKKDKTLVKVTGSQDIHTIERKMDEMVAAGQTLEFVCVVHPRQDRENYLWEKDKTEFKLPHGMLEGVKFLGYTKKNLGGSEINIGIEKDGVKCVIWHNYGDRWSYGKKYTTLRTPYGSGDYDVDVFIKLTLEKAPKEPRKIKEFTYKAQGGKHDKKTIAILAWTNKEALELLNEVGHPMGTGDFNHFVYRSWGNDVNLALKDIDRTQTCVYLVKERSDEEPIKLK